MYFIMLDINLLPIIVNISIGGSLVKFLSITILNAV